MRKFSVAVLVAGLVASLLVIVPAGPAGAAPSQGDWVGQVGSDGYVLAQSPSGQDLASLPHGVTFGLTQGERFSWANSTTDARALETPDESDRFVGTWFDPAEIAMTMTFPGGYDGLFSIYSLDWDSSDRRQTISIDDGSTVQVDDLTFSYNSGHWTEAMIDVAPGGTLTVTATKTGLYNSVIGGVFLGGVGAPYEQPPATSVVPILGPQGDWEGSFGGDGYVLAAWDNDVDRVSLPAGVSFELNNGAPFTWETNTNSIRALRGPDGEARRMSVWFDTVAVQAALQFTDAYQGQLAIYAADWDSNDRREKITISDGSQVFVGDIVTSFNSGVWIVADVDVAAGGRLTVTAKRTGDYNAVIAGLFLGGPVTSQAEVLDTQNKPQGNWVGVVGEDGYVLADWNGGTDLSSLPSGVSLSVGAETQRLVWNEFTNDPGALQSPSEDFRRVSTWFSDGVSQFSFSLDFAQAYSGHVSLYGLDYDAGGRAQTVDITGSVGPYTADFDSMALGEWVTFPVDVQAGDSIDINVIATGNWNSVLNGVFFGDALPDSASLDAIPLEAVLGPPLDSTVAVADPVEPGSGNFTDVWTDLSFGGPAAMINPSRWYSSRNGRTGVMGKGWTTVLDSHATASSERVTVQTPGGRAVTFVADGTGGWISPQEFSADLVDTAAGYRVDFTDDSSWQFDTDGALASISTWDGQSAQLVRDASDRVTSVEWSSGIGTGSASYSVAYDAAGLVSGITSDDGRTVSYGRDANGYLTSVTDTTGATTTMTVNADGLITELRDEESRLVVANVYDAANRVVSQTMPRGNEMTFDYDALTGITTVVDVASGDTNTYEFNDLRQLTAMTDPLGEVAVRTYDEDGNLDSQVDRRGNQAARVFDDFDNLVSETDETGATRSYTYDAANRLTTVTDELNRVTSFTYTGTDRIPTTITQPDGTQTSNVIANGLVTSTTDADGVTFSFAYDDERRLVSAIDGLGNTSTFTYDTAGRLATSISPLGLTTGYVYDAEGRLLSATEDDGSTTTFVYDLSGRLTSVTDPTGAVSSFAYDSAGDLATTTDPIARTTTMQYNASGELSGVVDPDGATTQWSLGELGRIESATDAAGVTTQLGYDESGNLASSSDADGNQRSFVYDERNNPISSTDERGNTTSITYDADGRIGTRTDAIGRQWSFAYDTNGRLSSVTNPDGTQDAVTYTAAGRQGTVVDRNGNQTTYTYDAAGRLVSVTQPDGSVRTLSYDADGRVTAVAYPTGLVEAMTYDTRDRVSSVTSTAGDTTTFTYSARNELLAITDPAGESVGIGYDAAGQATSVTARNGGTSTYAYDGSGKRTSRTGPTGIVDSWVFDAADRPVEHSDGLGNQTTTTYDSLGRPAVITDPSGRSRTYEYSPTSQVISVLYEAPGLASYEVTHSYDAVGRPVSMTDPSGTWTRTYDSQDRITSITEPDGDVTGYGYDDAGNRTSITYPNGEVVSYTYDANDRLVSVGHPDAGTTTYTYDLDGRMASETLPDGTLRTWTYTGGQLTEYTDSSRGTTTLTYDAVGRLVSTSGADAATYTYDAAGQLVAADRGGREWDYTYDLAGQLTASTDSQGDAQTFTHDAAGRLVDGTDLDGDTVYTFDDAGRLIETVDGAGTITTWTYDVRGLVSSIVTVSGDGGDDAPGCSADLVFTITGTSGDDHLVGTSGDDVIDGRGGDDVIEGRGGNDIICAGAGKDKVYGGGGDDFIVGGRGDDELEGGGGDDVIRGRRGDDKIEGGGGADELHGGRGDDKVEGDGGDDLLFAGAGKDKLEGGNGDDVLRGRKGDDELNGDGGKDVLFGGAGSDKLKGGDGADVLYGRGGDDKLDGGDGADILDGGRGDDELKGGDGNDSCDDGETNKYCEIVTALGNANNPTNDPPPVGMQSVETRTYDALGALIAVDVDGETAELTWDYATSVPQIIELDDTTGVSTFLYGARRIAEIGDSGQAEFFGYNTEGDSLDIAAVYSPYGEALDADPGVLGFGFRGELHIGDQVHLRARDLLPDIGVFTTRDPLDGVAGTTTETNPYHYANNDPINQIDPLGLRPGDDGGIDWLPQNTCGDFLGCLGDTAAIFGESAVKTVGGGLNAGADLIIFGSDVIYDPGAVVNGIIDCAAFVEVCVEAAVQDTVATCKQEGPESCIGRAFVDFSIGAAARGTRLADDIPTNLLDEATTGSAPRTTFSNLDPSDVPRVNGFQAINANSLSNASGRFNYTVLDDGSLVVANRRYGHIDLANGNDVLAAGEVHIVNGQIRSINNASGHYRPSGSSAQSAAENAFNALDLDVAPGAYREIGG